MTALTALLTIAAGLLSLDCSAVAQNMGATPPPNLDASSIYPVFGFHLSDGPGTPAGDAVAGLQVGMRAAKLGLTSQSALDAWVLAQPLLVPTPPVALLTGSGVVIFNGSNASALNVLMANPAGTLFRVTSSAITLDEPIRVVRSGVTVDFGSTQFATSSLPYMVRIEGTHDVTVSGGIFTKGNSAVLVSQATNITVDHAQITGLTGNGVVVTGSKHVTVTHNRISGLGGPGIFLLGGTSSSEIEQNDISNGTGQSNWMAGIVVSDRDADLAANPQAIFDGGGYWPIYSPIRSRLNPPHDNLIAFNHVGTNTSSGIYFDGGVRNVVYSNSVQGNAKEGLCLDNGATANVVTSNTIQQNGNRWGQSDTTLQLDFVFARLPDGTAAAKLPAISIDNGMYNVLYANNISHNSGGGIKMVRTSFFNVLGLNTIENNNDGASVYFRFFGVELGAAAGDVPSPELDFGPSRGNVIFSSVIQGTHGSGIFLQGGSDQNAIFDNVIKGALDWAIESEAPMQNTAQDNLTDLPSKNLQGCCSFRNRPRGMPLKTDSVQ